MNQKEVDRQNQELKEAWQFVMSSEQGRLVVRDILRFSGLRVSPFTGATNQTIKNVGMSDVGRFVEERGCQYAFDDYMKLLREDLQRG